MDKEVSSGLVSSWEKTTFGRYLDSVGLKEEERGEGGKEQGLFSGFGLFPRESKLRNNTESQRGGLNALNAAFICPPDSPRRWGARRPHFTRKQMTCPRPHITKGQK